MKRTYLIALMALLGGLAGCGGSDGPHGTDVFHAPLMYGQLTSFTVIGPNLDKGIALSAPGCATVVEVPTEGTQTRKVFTCTPSRVGPLVVTVVGGGMVLHTLNTFVPQPQMTLRTRLAGVLQPDIVMELYPNNAPLSVTNVLQYVASGFYTGKIFHRVIPGFVVQTGGYGADMVAASTRAPIKLESGNGLSNVRGTVAMARTNVLESATSQFFINTVDNVSLDTTGGGYAVFGKVIAGLDVVDTMSKVPTGTAGGLTDVPLVPIVIESAIQNQ